MASTLIPASCYIHCVMSANSVVGYIPNIQLLVAVLRCSLEFRCIVDKIVRINFEYVTLTSDNIACCALRATDSFAAN